MRSMSRPDAESKANQGCIVRRSTPKSSRAEIDRSESGTDVSSISHLDHPIMFQVDVDRAASDADNQPTVVALLRSNGERSQPSGRAMTDAFVP